MTTEKGNDVTGYNTFRESASLLVTSSREKMTSEKQTTCLKKNSNSNKTVILKVDITKNTILQVRRNVE